MAPKPPERGDLVEVRWVDIYEDATGDPDQADVSVRTSYGLFWGRSQSHGVPVIVTTTTRDDESTAQSGYCCYPEAVVRRMTVVRRARKRKGAA